MMGGGRLRSGRLRKDFSVDVEVWNAYCFSQDVFLWNSDTLEVNLKSVVLSMSVQCQCFVDVGSECGQIRVSSE